MPALPFSAPRSLAVVLLVAAALLPRAARVEERGLYEVHTLYVDADEARLQGWGYDIAGLERRAGRIWLVTSEPGAQRLSLEGFDLRLRERSRPLGEAPRRVPRSGDPARAGSPTRATGEAPIIDDGYHDPGAVAALLEAFAETYPLLTRLEQIGESHQGRPILALMVSANADTDEDEPSLIFRAQTHAREVMGTEVVLDMIERLLLAYTSNGSAGLGSVGSVDSVNDGTAQLTRFVDELELWFVPSVNPDGSARVFTADNMWRKNCRDNDADGDVDDGDGVDLNRNLPFGWGGACGGSSDTPGASTYRGPAPSSEPEARALRDLAARRGALIDVGYHSAGELLLFAPSCHPSWAPRLGGVAPFAAMASAVAAVAVQADGGIGYQATPFAAAVDGTCRDGLYAELGTFAMVIELNSWAEGGFTPDYGLLRDPTVAGIRPAWEALMARALGAVAVVHAVDATTNEPLVARVSIGELSGPAIAPRWTNASFGRCDLLLPPGAYSVRVHAAGYESWEGAISLGEEPVDVAVGLTPRPGTRLLEEDFEGASATTWRFGLQEDTASSGRWALAEPRPSFSGDVPGHDLRYATPSMDASPGLGRNAAVTGNASDLTPGLDAVRGTSTLLSPPFDPQDVAGVQIFLQATLVNTTNMAGTGLTLDLVHWEEDLGVVWQSPAITVDDLSTPAALAGEPLVAQAVEASIPIEEPLIATAGSPGMLRLRLRAEGPPGAPIAEDGLLEIMVDEVLVLGLSSEAWDEEHGDSVTELPDVLPEDADGSEPELPNEALSEHLFEGSDASEPETSKTQDSCAAEPGGSVEDASPYDARGDPKVDLERLGTEGDGGSMSPSPDAAVGGLTSGDASQGCQPGTRAPPPSPLVATLLVLLAQVAYRARRRSAPNAHEPASNRSHAGSAPS